MVRVSPIFPGAAPAVARQRGPPGLPFHREVGTEVAARLGVCHVELVRDVPAPATVQTVWKSLVEEMPSLVEYERTMSVAVNAEYARMAASVQDGDEVAFLPPVSGG